MAVAAGALDLGGHDLLEAPVVEEAGELVGDRLALHGLVQVDVLDRDRRLVGEVGEQLALAVREGAVAARDGDDADHLVAVLGGAERRGQRARAADLDLGDLAGVDDRRLGGVQRAPERLRLAGAGDLLEAVLGVAHRGAAGRGADAVDGGLHDDLQQPDAVEAGGERLADAADRLLEPRALALELLQAGLELARHRVELLAERGELVVALGRHGDREVAGAEPLGGHQQALDLRLEAPRHGDREDEGEHEEADEGGRGAKRRSGRRGSAVSWSGSSRRTVTSPPTAGASNDLTR